MTLSLKNISKLGNPLFLLSVTLLIVNDWYLKGAFSIDLTGKLSDFAGLFAFPYLLNVIIPDQKKQIHIGTAFLFILWKSELSNPIIDFINYVGLPIHRTVDTTDLIALLSLPGSYYASELNHSVFRNRGVLNVVLVVSSISFFATTLPPAQQRKYTNINNNYHFDIPKRELVSRLNAIQLKEVFTVSKMSGGQVDFDSQKNTFSYRGTTDTLALILDSSKIEDSDTIVYKTSYVEIMILGDEAQSTLKLLSVYRMVPLFTEKEYRNKAIRTFEKRVVKKIRRFPKPPTE